LPARGLASSVQLGMVAIAQSRPPPRRVLLLLGDQPRLSAEQIASLLTQPVDSSRPIIVPRYEDGQPGNPVLLDAAVWQAVAERAVGDAGARYFLSDHPDLIRLVACDDVARPDDIDTPADLAAWRDEEQRCS